MMKLKFLPEFSNMKVISEADDDGKIVAITDAENPIRAGILSDLR